MEVRRGVISKECCTLCAPRRRAKVEIESPFKSKGTCSLVFDMPGHGLVRLSPR